MCGEARHERETADPHKSEIEHRAIERGSRLASLAMGEPERGEPSAKKRKKYKWDCEHKDARNGYAHFEPPMRDPDDNHQCNCPETRTDCRTSGNRSDLG